MDPQDHQRVLSPLPIPRLERHQILWLSCGAHFTMVIARSPKGVREYWSWGSNAYDNHCLNHRDTVVTPTLNGFNDVFAPDSGEYFVEVHSGVVFSILLTSEAQNALVFHN